ncbi:MAG: spore germination protein [Clostridiales bacterium]|nr:spore germination protein [Clostridiales bacterium]
MQKRLNDNIKAIQEQFGNSNELVVKNIDTPHNKCAVIYFMGLTDTIALSDYVVSPLIQANITLTPQTAPSKLPLCETTTEDNLNNICNELLKGKGVLIFDNSTQAVILGIDKFKERAITEPPTSTVLKGPRAGFVENLKTNLSTLRKILASTKLRTYSTSIGRHTQTSVCVVYLDGIADPHIVDTIKERLSAIDIDGVLDSHYITQFLEEHKNSMFKQIGNSEKPDIVAGKLLEGRVAIIVDGSPMVLTVPFIYLEDVQSSDDYYSNSKRASFVRWIRIASIIISTLTPALYIAIILHHYKAIPLKFLITIINTTKGLPLTPFAEILFVLLLFEILYEASLRMPKYLGLALSIVGALILGDTAVKAGLISPPAVMIVAISSLSIYCVPDQAPQLYLLRLLFTFAGGALGIFGIISMGLFLLLHLSDFDSYGGAYFAPVAPLVKEDIKDALVRAGITQMKTRPTSINKSQKNRKRQGGTTHEQDSI